MGRMATQPADGFPANSGNPRRYQGASGAPNGHHGPPNGPKPYKADPAWTSYNQAMTSVPTARRPLTLQEAADELGVHFNTVRRQVDKGIADPGSPNSLPSFLAGPGARRILPEAIDLRKRGLDPWAAVADTMPDASLEDA